MSSEAVITACEIEPGEPLGAVKPPIHGGTMDVKPACGPGDIAAGVEDGLERRYQRRARAVDQHSIERRRNVRPTGGRPQT